MIPALRRPPCLVAFSGGRDSSSVLAVTTLTARRHGLPLPIPVTCRFEGLPETEEASWQESVVRHLELPEWERLWPGSDLEFVGPLASFLLRREGVRWPPNRHLLAAIVSRAAGGSVLTGVDGDGLFDRWRWRRAVDVLARRRRPVAHDVLSIALALSPRRVRLAVLHRRDAPDSPWLRPDAARALGARYHEWVADEPWQWDRRVRWFSSCRYVAMLRRNARSIGQLHGVLVVPLFLDPSFLSTLAHHGGVMGWGGRTETMRLLFGDLLPDPVLTRTSKAEFTRVFWGEICSEFARSWTGRGIDHDLVDADALGAMWREGPGRAALARTGLLLQSAWLAEQG